MSLKGFLLDITKDFTKQIVKDKITTLISKSENNKDEVNTDISLGVDESEEKYFHDYSIPISSEILDTYDFDSVPEPNIINKDADKTILLVDDIPYTKMLFAFDFKTIDTIYNKNVHTDFKIVECFGKKAGWMAYKYCVLNGNKVDFALIDITLGNVIKYKESMIEVDGIDIACNITNHFPDMKFLLFTSHSLNTKSMVVNKYNTKLKNGLNVYLEDRYLNKNSNRYEHIYNFLYSNSNTEDQHGN